MREKVIDIQEGYPTLEEKREIRNMKYSPDELTRGWRWEGFLGGSYYNTLRLAKICQGKKDLYYQTKLIKVKTKGRQTCFKIMLK